MDTIESVNTAVPHEETLQHTPKRSWPIQKILISCLLLTSLGVLLFGAWSFRSSLRLMSVFPQADSLQSGPVVSNPDESQQDSESTALLNPEDPISLKIAQDYYLGSDYPKAHAVYQRLLENLPGTGDTDALRDFLRLNIALCMQKMGDDEQSADFLMTLHCLLYQYC